MMRDGGFPRQDMGKGREIGGKTLGLIGFGGIGRNVAKRAAALGMELVAYDPAFSPEPGLEVAPLSLAECLATADAISLHMPLTDTTRNMINAETLAVMRPGAVLVNTARGGIVDHAALADALRSGHLGGAALDVFEEEPTTADSLAMFSDLPDQ
jgi:(S)-sulfolactate dehydrogenase